MNFSPAGLFAGLIFGAVGAGFFLYGRRQMRPVYLVCGTALAIYPWFVSNLVVLVAIGAALVAAPFAAAWWFDL